MKSWVLAQNVLKTEELSDCEEEDEIRLSQLQKQLKEIKDNEQMNKGQNQVVVKEKRSNE